MCYNVVMKILRVSDEVHTKVKALAEKDRRTINAMAEILLETGMGKPFTGDSPNEEEVGVPVENTPSPEKINVSDLLKTPTFEETKTAVHEYKVEKKSEPTAQLDPGNGELDCCQHPTRPCKHWVWDINTGEGYINSLSGRKKEA